MAPYPAFCVREATDTIEGRHRYLRKTLTMPRFRVLEEPAHAYMRGFYGLATGEPVTPGSNIQGGIMTTINDQATTRNVAFIHMTEIRGASRGGGR